MTKLLSLSVVVLCLLMAGPSLAADSGCGDWDGVWRLHPTDPKDGSAVHLKFTEDEGRCRVFHFEPDFTRVIEGRDLAISEDEVKFSSPPLSRRFEITLKRDGDRIQGEATILHVQYRASFGRAGHRVSSDGGWDPVESVKAQADEFGLANLAGSLVEEAPKASLEEFEEYWSSKVEPVYYSVIHDVAYGRSGGLEERRKRLTQLLELLNDESFVSLVRLLTAEHEKVVKSLQESAPELFYPNVFLTMPTFGAFDVSVESMGTSLLVRLAVDSEKLAGNDKPGGWLAREHLKLPLYRIFGPKDPTSISRLVMDGLAGYWAVSKGLASHPFECLPEPVEDRPEMSSTEQRLKMMEAIRQRTRGRELDSRDIALVGFDFARQLTTSFSTSEILVMSKSQLGEHLWNFLEASAE